MCQSTINHNFFSFLKEQYFKHWPSAVSIANRSGLSEIRKKSVHFYCPTIFNVRLRSCLVWILSSLVQSRCQARFCFVWSPSFNGRCEWLRGLSLAHYCSRYTWMSLSLSLTTVKLWDTWTIPRSFDLFLLAMWVRLWMPLTVTSKKFQNGVVRTRF